MNSNPTHPPGGSPFLQICLVVVLSQVLFSTSALADDAKNANRIRPYAENPRYWQYKGKPVMLLGASKTDHLFLIDDLKMHLDEIKATGGNYVRNTMSQREGKELKPYKLLVDGRFDLDQWNEDYWNRFENMLLWTAERDIIVQIEVWDRFDYSDGSSWNHWQHSPWRPAININYDGEESGLADTYGNHPASDKQPFFHTVPNTEHYQKKYDLIRKHQERFVDKMLSYSLEHDHVLYCMNNETSTPALWGQYWIEFIHSRARAKGLTVCTTDMFDDAFEGEDGKRTPIIFNDSQHYQFADISQVNGRVYDDDHWKKLGELLRLVNKHPRPSNHVKIYAGGYSSWGSGAPEDGIERFWRNLLGGSAAARFHRPGIDEGIALNDSRKGSLKAARLLEERIKYWDITPHQELLLDRSPNEAYLAADPGNRYALYFTNQGSVGLDLTKAKGTFEVTWISVTMGQISDTTSAKLYARTKKQIQGGSVITLSAPYKGGLVAALVRKHEA
jgi:hypothetical protein